jgi:hypothetical protein
MIRIERASLPDGLRAVARRDPNGDLVLFVSDSLDPAGQRLAVRTALRASRRAGWRGAVPILVALPWAARLLLHRAAALLRIRPIALASAAGVAGVAAVALIVAVAGQPHGSTLSANPPAQERIGGGGSLPGAGSSPAPAPGRTASGSRTSQPGTGQPQPGSSSPGSGRTPPAPGRTRPVPSPSPTRTPEPSPSATPSPTPTPAPTKSAKPSPSPSPSPSPTGHHGKPGRKSCVIILGIKICVPLSITL